MSKSSIGRGVVFALLTALGSLLVGAGSPASAAPVVYQSENANVRVSGGEATALNECINDAQDGFINTQQNYCNQIATAANTVILDNVFVMVYGPSTFQGRPLFYRSNATVSASGGLANAINSCVNDSRDGVINNQLNACQQYAAAGNTVLLNNVQVAVYAS